MTLLPLFAVARAGLGPVDVLVLYNAEDPGAVEVANAYAAARNVPLQHLCGLTGIDPAEREVDFPTFDLLVRTPLEACLAALPQPDDIDAIVTVRGLPYVVLLDDGVVGLEALLQVGRGVDFDGEVAGQNQVFDGGVGVHVASVKNPDFFGGPPGSCDPADLRVDNPSGPWYRATCDLQELPELPRGFQRTRKHELGSWDFTDELFVVTRLDGFDHDDALALIERSVSSDGTYPDDASFLCMAGADSARAARDPECELATRRLAEAGFESEWVAPHDPALSGRRVVAYLTGTQDLTGAIDDLDYVPGAIACNLTSYGALPQNFFCEGDTCPGDEAQTSIARFVRAGATGAHGTVAEPLNNSFPNAAAMLLYASGYTLGESFHLATEHLYWMNLVLGGPLAAPFAERPTIAIPPSTREDEPLRVVASHPDGVTELRLYIDGVLVASAEGDTVEWEHGAALNDRIPLLAVAVAGDGTVDRPGWPVGSQTLRAEAQGWRVGTVQITASPASLGGDEEPRGGCGCGHGGPRGRWIGGLLLLRWVGRRDVTPK